MEREIKGGGGKSKRKVEVFVLVILQRANFFFIDRWLIKQCVIFLIVTPLRPTLGTGTGTGPTRPFRRPIRARRTDMHGV